SGDHILAMCALGRGETTIVGTVMSNLGVENYLAERGVTLLRSQVGDRYVLETLKAQGLTLGGEQSGHVLFLDKAPTGDGMLTALQTLAAVRESGKPLESWVKEIPLYPQTLLNVPVEDKRGVAGRLEVRQAVERAEHRLAGKGRINLRPSGTEPLVRVMVEGQSQDLIEAIASEVAAVVARA
ncbi:MAG: phosphoglucosamine mutase, partial [Deinococcota bacterium]|nr:phosphoglucosamine mutase [Deinococcota bacterium]